MKDDFHISKDKRIQDLYIIEFHKYSEPIIKSLIKTKIISGATISSNYRTIHFKATSIQTLKQFQEKQQKLRIHVAAKLLLNLASQLKYLISHHNQSFIGYTPENIIVIDQNKFAYISNEYLSSIEKNKILMTFPFSLDDFFISPEQNKLTKLPSTIHYKTAYYSLACLIIYSLSSEDDFLKDDTDKMLQERFMDQLESLPIKETKLYWVLKKCLVEEPIERSLLFI